MSKSMVEQKLLSKTIDEENFYILLKYSVEVTDFVNTLKCLSSYVTL